MDWNQVTEELKAPLDAAAVKPPPQGKYGDYVEGTHCIREANRIFGYDGWNYQTTSLTCTNDKPNGDKHFVGYFAIVRVTVDGVTREDVGHGSGVSKNHGDAHDSAVKEAVTDALKRSLRTFGNTFGLALYEKDKSKREVEVKPDQSQIAKNAAELKGSIIGKIKDTDPGFDLRSNKHFQTDLARLKSMDPEAVEDVEDALREREAA